MSAPSSRPGIEWQDIGGVAVVHFITPVLRDERAIQAAFDALNGLLEGGRTHVVINFHGLKGIASLAIGKLVRLNDRLQPPDGRLVLCALTPIVDEIMDIMQLRKRFHIYPTEQAALESFL